MLEFSINQAKPYNIFLESLYREVENLSPLTIRIILYVISHTFTYDRAEKSCFVSQSTIANDFKCTRKTVNRALDLAARLGWIIKEHKVGDYTPCTYKISPFMFKKKLRCTFLKVLNSFKYVAKRSRKALIAINVPQLCIKYKNKLSVLVETTKSTSPTRDQIFLKIKNLIGEDPVTIAKLSLNTTSTLYEALFLTQTMHGIRNYANYLIVTTLNIANDKKEKLNWQSFYRKHPNHKTEYQMDKMFQNLATNSSPFKNESPSSFASSFAKAPKDKKATKDKEKVTRKTSSLAFRHYQLKPKVVIDDCKNHHDLIAKLSPKKLALFGNPYKKRHDESANDGNCKYCNKT